MPSLKKSIFVLLSDTLPLITQRCFLLLCFKIHPKDETFDDIISNSYLCIGLKARLLWIYNQYSVPVRE